MPDVRKKTFAALGLSFVVALLLTAVPMPGWLADWRPAWVAMMLIYWCLSMPERVGIGSAWMLGLVLDVYTGAVLGQNALGLSVIAYLTLRAHKQIRVFPMRQQALLICVYLVVFQFITLWIRGVMGVPPQHWTFWTPAVTSMLLWPVLYLLMGRIRQKYGIF